MTLMPVVGYEGEYSVTEDGQVWSHKSDRFLKTQARVGGIRGVTLSSNGRVHSFAIGRLVAVAFGTALATDEAVWHLDGNPANDHYLNMRGGTWVELQAHNLQRGVGGAARLLSQDRCKRGHEFSPENTYIDSSRPDRGRVRCCRTCKNTAARIRRQNSKTKEKEK